MSVQELEKAVAQLPSPEPAQFAAWFEEYQADLWDKQIEQDAVSGRLDALAEQANQELEVRREGVRRARLLDCFGVSLLCGNRRKQAGNTQAHVVLSSKRKVKQEEKNHGHDEGL